MKLDSLPKIKGSTHRHKILGRGRGTGHGKTSGRGHKGMKARSGGGHRPGFEGGQMPLYRKLPQRGFNNYEFRTEIAILNVGELAALDTGLTEINAEALAAAGLIRKGEKTVKILGDGEITRALKVTAAKFTASAKAKIEKAGGQAIIA